MSATSGLIGTILIFFFGLPPKISEDGKIYLITEQSDESERNKARIFKYRSYYGLSLICISFLLQIFDIVYFTS